MLTAAGPSAATACISAEWSTASKGSDGQSSTLCRHIRHGGTDDTSISSRADDCANSCAVNISDQCACSDVIRITKLASNRWNKSGLGSYLSVSPRADIGRLYDNSSDQSYLHNQFQTCSVMCCPHASGQTVHLAQAASVQRRTDSDDVIGVTH